jgi:hypothetical protein
MNKKFSAQSQHSQEPSAQTFAFFAGFIFATLALKKPLTAKTAKEEAQRTQRFALSSGLCALSLAADAVKVPGFD